MVSHVRTFLSASDNNRSSTVLKLFQQYGLPSRVRSDKGGGVNVESPSEGPWEGEYDNR